MKVLKKLRKSKKKLKLEIEKTRKEIILETRVYSEAFSLRSKNDFADKFQESYQTQLDSYSQVVSEYIKILELLLKELDLKENKNIFSTCIKICMNLATITLTNLKNLFWTIF